MRFFRYVLLAIIILSVGLITNVQTAHASETDGTISASNNIAKALNPAGGDFNFGIATTGVTVHVTDAGLTGYVWSENYGWINLGPLASSTGVVNDAEGTLSGFAWGSTLGWINFNPHATSSPHIGVTIDEDGIFHGYAWSTNIGWISFNCANNDSCDDEDFKITTDWRPESVREAEEPGGGGGSSGGGGSTPTPPSEPVTPTTPTEPAGPDTPTTPTEPGDEPVGPENPENPTNPEEPTDIADSISQSISNTVGVVTEQFNTAFESTRAVINTPEGNVVTKAVTTTGIAVGTATGIATMLFANPLAASEVVLVPLRILSLILTAFGLKRRNRPWGTVYDSVTKQPLDPVYVTLTDEFGKEVATSITDLDGRFGFFVPKGTYYLKAQKTHYTFPSQKMANKTSDELYTDVYHGEKIIVAEDGAVIFKSIPMDQENFDWNEFAKNKMNVMKFHSRRERILAGVSRWFFRFGFVVALVSLYAAPEPYNLTIFIVYVAVIGMRLLSGKRKATGSVTESATGAPLSFAIVTIYSEALGRDLLKKVADQYGRYYALVPKGEYRVKISQKNADESYTEVYDKAYDASNGVINSNIKV